ncbi:hypothetical protein Tco_1218443 [Tanacetum coccineum]
MAGEGSCLSSVRANESRIDLLKGCDQDAQQTGVQKLSMEKNRLEERISLTSAGLNFVHFAAFKITAYVIMPITRMLAHIYTILASYGMKVPQFMPLRIRLLTCNKTFNSAKAKECLGYLPTASFRRSSNPMKSVLYPRGVGWTFIGNLRKPIEEMTPILE